jgi:hypothetical protein
MHYRSTLPPTRWTRTARASIVAAAWVFAFAAPLDAVAAPCPAVGSCDPVFVQLGNRHASVHGPKVVQTYYGSLPSLRYTMASACGAATSCYSTMRTAFVARWPYTPPRTTDSTGGCIFRANGGANVCKVGRDGLPVELLQFGVE